MQVSFGRAIKIQPDTGYNNNKTLHQQYDETLNLLNTIKGESKVFGSDFSQEMGTFLRAQLGDYSEKTGMLIQKVAGDIYLFTGDDVEKAKRINENYENKLKFLSDYALEDKKLLQGLQEKREERLLELVEDGKDGKKLSEISFVSNIPYDNKIGVSVDYFSSEINKAEGGYDYTHINRII